MYTQNYKKYALAEKNRYKAVLKMCPSKDNLLEA